MKHLFNLSLLVMTVTLASCATNNQERTVASNGEGDGLGNEITSSMSVKEGEIKLNYKKTTHGTFEDGQMYDQIIYGSKTIKKKISCIKDIIKEEVIAEALLHPQYGIGADCRFRYKAELEDGEIVNIEHTKTYAMHVPYKTITKVQMDSHGGLIPVLYRVTRHDVKPEARAKAMDLLRTACAQEKSELEKMICK